MKVGLSIKGEVAVEMEHSFKTNFSQNTARSGEVQTRKGLAVSVEV